ncbi:hypothetical protein TNCV_1527161 [Trichonephila clavipes]|nr:hypothetical protein TNCV_1527161 [Trichonephila clavipes]
MGGQNSSCFRNPLNNLGFLYESPLTGCGEIPLVKPTADIHTAPHGWSSQIPLLSSEAKANFRYQQGAHGWSSETSLNQSPRDQSRRFQLPTPTGLALVHAQCLRTVYVAKRCSGISLQGSRSSR